MKPFAYIASLTSLAIAFFAASSLYGKSPNIILILTDDHGWSQTSHPMDDRVAASKSDYLETPHIDAIAKGGIRFTSGYSPAPLCTPTRRSIACGTSAARSGSEFKSDWVPAKHLTIPKALKAANPNYKCAHFGKWGEQMISTPEECGYDASDGMTGNNTGGMPGSLGIKDGHFGKSPHIINNEDPKLTFGVTDRAVAFMDKQHKAGHPFYVQVSYYAQHLTVVCKDETLKKYQAKGTPDRGYSEAWAAMLEEMDKNVGRILKQIDDLGIRDNTYVFFTTDNGGRGTVPGGDIQRLATNHPITGAKHDLREGGIRVPFIASGPGIKAGSMNHTAVAGYDFLPTFYDLALSGNKPEGDAPDMQEVDGVSIRPLLHAEDSSAFSRKHGALFFHRPRKQMSAMRQGDYKLFITWQTDDTYTAELFDVSSNPIEAGRNIAQDNPERVQQMTAHFLKFLKSVDAESVAEFAGQNKKKKGGKGKSKGKGKKRNANKAKKA